MFFWTFMLVCDLLVPITMILFGWIFIHRPPKKINSIYGYRTSRSMKNQDTWEFAHYYCGKLWGILGTIMFVITIVFQIFVLGKEQECVGALGLLFVFIQMSVLILTVIPVQRALKHTFDENGNRK